MKQLLVYIALILICSCQIHQLDKKLALVKNLPSFKIISIDSSVYINSESIPAGCPTIFMYFDPDCEHCQWETEGLMRHISQLKQTKIYMITNDDSISVIKKFRSYYHLDTISNFIFCKDYNYSFYRAYSSPTVPYMAIYDGSRKLKKIYKGETDVQSIITAVQE